MSVRAYYSTDPEAPVLSGQAGTLVNLLKKCLVDGYGNQGQGTWKEPLGWEGVYRNDYLRAGFRASAPGATGYWLEVNDSGAESGSFRVASVMMRSDGLTGYDGGGAPAGGSSLLTGVITWMKSSTLDDTARSWVLVGDERLVHLFVSHHASYVEHFAGFAFGDFVSFRAGDQHNCLLIASGDGGGSVAPASATQYHQLAVAIPGDEAGHWFARAYTGIGAAVQFGKVSVRLSNATPYRMGGAAGFTYPGPADNGLHLAPILLAEGAVPRGVFPGVWNPLHVRPQAHRDVIEDVDGLAGRRLLVVMTSVGSGDINTGRVMLDITGPWR